MNRYLSEVAALFAVGRSILYVPGFLILPVLFILSACHPTEESPMIDITFDRPEGSSAELALDDGRTLIDVIDSRGINGMNARLIDGEWPQEIVVLLRLRGLEHLELRYGNYAITTGRSSNESPDPPLILYVTDENGDVTQAPVSSSIYFPDIRRTKDGYEIILPPHFFRDEFPSFSMQWIDFYR